MRRGRPGVAERERQLHETATPHDLPEPPSDRSVGAVFAGFFALLGLFPLSQGRSPALELLAVSGLFAAATLLVPAWLAPLSRLWFRLGLGLARVVNPVVLGLLFFFAIVPAGLIRRIRNRDPLRLSWDDSRESYWVERRPPGPGPDTMGRQF